MFAYCTNDPVNNEDPDGDIAWWVGAAVGGAAFDSAVYLIQHRRGGATWKGLGKAAAKGALTGVLFGGAGKIIKGVRSAKAAKKITSMCFTGDTLVSTKDGDKPIKDIKVGDEVYSENPETGEKGLKKVKRVFVNESDKLVHVYVNGKEIKATPEHPFWVVNEGWVEAGDLKQGDEVLLYSGEVANVEKVEKEELDKAVKVYNFEVEDWHTYFVSEEDILVHNNCAAPYGVDRFKGGVTKQLTSKHKPVTHSSMESVKRKVLGHDYVQVGKGKWRNKSGTRQFRAKPNDLKGHSDGRGPHVHIEFLKKTKDGYLVRRNYHVKYKK
ncbi:MAG: hypothetical protein KH369_05040 [Paraclostridium bifermentans]|uniref:polymorphic toxin-type HINT domain-containing protein n=1 Tax=Paraclostridium bifermentans TaxID=1490 RepID=UPI001DACC5BE|nr:polymorphic toxin-type HINT domain-containing protein [Paraclostridium bifermentans]MBS6507543.1 hypothetical protein [Paraclostridium bifermentans]MDU3802161.1 polymorphic toxin-type HINT domain-containing protein [Paraclostridium bifermentans]